MRKYTVRYEWDPEGAWIITVPEVPGCRTEAKTLEEGQALIRDALSLFVDDAQTAILVNLVVPPPGLTRAVKRAEAADREISRSLAKNLRLPRKDAEALLTGARFSALEHEIVHGRDVTIVTEKMPVKIRLKEGTVLYTRVSTISRDQTGKKAAGRGAKAGTRRVRPHRGR